MGEKAEEGGSDLRCLLPAGRMPSWRHMQAAIMRECLKPQVTASHGLWMCVGIGGGES